MARAPVNELTGRSTTGGMAVVGRKFIQQATPFLLALLLAGCATSVPHHHSTTAKPRTAVDELAIENPLESASSEKTAAAHAHYGAGVIQEMNGDLDAALENYRQAALEDPGNEWLVLEVSRRLLQNKKPEQALEVLTRASERPGVSAPILARLGMVYSQLGKADQAVAASRAAIKKAPDTLAAYQNLFLTYVQAHRPQEALKVLDEAARLSRPKPEFLLGLSDLYVNFGLQEPAQREVANSRALALLQRVEKLNLTSPALRLKLADSFNLQGDHKKAAQLYLELLKRLPDVPMLREQVHAKLADIYLRGSNPKAAREQLEEIVKDDPTNPLAYYYLGSLAAEEKQSKEAIDYFKKTILLSPGFEQAYYDLVLAQINQNQGTNALRTLDEMRTRFPRNFLQEFWTGMVYNHLKNYKEALGHYISAEIMAQAAEPKRLNALFYFQMGAAYERQGELAEAEKAFQKSLKLDPNFSEAQNYLGYMWAEHGTNLDQARELLEKAVKTEPKNAAFLDSLGWVFYKLKQPRQALEYIQKAVALSEEPDATLFDHLGDIYQALNEPDKAREAWSKSVSLEANETVKKKLQGSGAQSNSKPPDTR
jgi:tetratricopeptide (TPR) repeat protein